MSKETASQLKNSKLIKEKSVKNVKCSEIINDSFRGGHVCSINSNTCMFLLTTFPSSSDRPQTIRVQDKRAQTSGKHLINPVPTTLSPGPSPRNNIFSYILTCPGTALKARLCDPGQHFHQTEQELKQSELREELKDSCFSKKNTAIFSSEDSLSHGAVSLNQDNEAE